MVRRGTFGLAPLSTVSLLLLGQPVASASQAPFDGFDHVVEVSDTASLLANAGRANTALVLADESSDPGGSYVLEACPEGVDERTDTTCGMIVLGPGSGLFGSGRTELIDGVPTGNVTVEGPLLDCGALSLEPTDWGPGDANGWDLACVEMAGGNTISGVRIDNGPIAAPQVPGQGEHRNGILVQPGDGEALIEHAVITDVRRGVLIGAAAHATTDVVVRANIVRRTELAGLNVLPSAVPPVAIDRPRVSARLVANHLDDIGRIGINVAWGLGDGGSRVNAELVDNVVQDAFVGLIVFGEAFLTPAPAAGHRVRVDVRGGHINSHLYGTALLAYDNGPQPEAVDNSVKLEMSDVTFGPTALPLYVQYDPWGPGNEYVADFHGNTYTGAEPGLVFVCAFSFDTSACVPPGSDPPFQFTGSREDLAASNDNFDFDGVDDAHIGWRPTRPPRR